MNVHPRPHPGMAKISLFGIAIILMLAGIAAWASAPTRRGLLDGNRIGRRKGVLEGFVERLFLAPTLIAIAIVLMRFARFGSAIISVSLTALMRSSGI